VLAIRDQAPSETKKFQVSLLECCNYEQTKARRAVLTPTKRAKMYRELGSKYTFMID
jgi:hypothetical protein